MPHVWRSDANSIAFIAHSTDIRQMLDHIGVQAEPPCISPPVVCQAAIALPPTCAISGAFAHQIHAILRRMWLNFLSFLSYNKWSILSYIRGDLCCLCDYLRTCKIN